MCDNCTCNERTQSYEALKVSVEQQRRIIDDLDAVIGDQQAVIGELQTENAAKDREIKHLRGIIAKAGKLCERLTDQMAGAA